MFKLTQSIKSLLGEYWKFRLKNLRDKILYSNRREDIDASLYSSFINKGDLCFDVGANIGNKVDILLSLGAQVVAIEPQESCYRILNYKYGKKIKLVKKGVGETEGMLELHVSNSNTISSFSTEWINAVKNSRFQNYNWSKVVKVPMTTLDRLISEFGKPRYIKIDVEGFELEVLKGLSSSVPMISFEYTIPERVDRVQQCLNHIESLNPNVRCNYTEGEHMKFISPEWIEIGELRKLIVKEDFTKDGFGDIYIKSS